MILALLIGFVAGLRAMTAPAIVSWAARLGWLDLTGTSVAFLGNPVTAWILPALAILELIGDQHPSTPSRTVPVQFGTRLVTGGLSGAAIVGGSGGMHAAGLIAGLAGAVAGTLGGGAFRGRLARSFGRDRPAALIEDAVALGMGLAVGFGLR